MTISFGSNYFINQKSGFPYIVLDKIESMKNVEVSQDFCSPSESFKTGVFSKITVNAPDSLDNKIERLLISNNINFSKSSIKDALNLKNILSRIELEPELRSTHKLVLLDVKTLDDLFKKDGLSHIKPQGANALNNRYNEFCDYLRSGKKIYATRVTFNEFNGELSASISNGRHRFAVLRDMGMEKMPVALSKDSIEVAKKHGLL